MALSEAADIRNVALVGHSGAGKTTLAEALLFKTGVTNRLGCVNDGSSMLDADEESKERKHSVDSSFFHVTHSDTLINAFDTPGMPDYCGTALAALGGVETAVGVIGANSGIGVSTRRMLGAAQTAGLARILVVTRIDAENVNLDDILSSIQETFGANCLPINLPTGGGTGVISLLEATEGETDIGDVAAAHTQLVDAIVETDDTLMEQYMETGTVALDKLVPAMRGAVASGHVTPVLFVCATSGVGITELLDTIVQVGPSPVDGKQRLVLSGNGDEATETAVDGDRGGSFVGQVLKVMTDPKSNIKYSIARVFGGSIKGDGHLFVSGERKGHRPAHVMKMQGSQHEEVEAAAAGDIIAFTKIEMAIGSALFDKSVEGTIEMPKRPTPMFALSITPKNRADIEKIGTALHRFAEEDPCFEYHREEETHELVMQGLGDQHLTVIRSKMKRYFKIEVDTKPPKIPYHETISGSVEHVEYTHKKQSGGAGQFGRVFINMEPNERGAGYEFIDKIFGGAIDQPFRPSVNKGIKEQMKRGVIAGYPVVDVKVSLVDGKTHPVDSKDIAFQIAGRQVFKKAFAQCKPILLEPIVNIEVSAPADFMGDITRDIAGKRGQIAGQDMLPGNQICVRAVVPLAEVSGYSSQLKSVTGGQGSYVMELSHYDVVPPMVQQQIVAAYQPHGEEE